MFAFVVLTLLLPFLHIEHAATWQTAVLHPIYVLAGSALGGYVGQPAAARAGRLARQAARTGSSSCWWRMVVLTIGVAHSLKLSVPLALVTFGMLSRNLDRGHALLPVRFGDAGQLFFVLLFVLTGASLEFHALGVGRGRRGRRVHRAALPRQGARAAAVRRTCRASGPAAPGCSRSRCCRCRAWRS